MLLNLSYHARHPDARPKKGDISLSLTPPAPAAAAYILHGGPKRLFSSCQTGDRRNGVCRFSFAFIGSWAFEDFFRFLDLK